MQPYKKLPYNYTFARCPIPGGPIKGTSHKARVCCLGCRIAFCVHHIGNHLCGGAESVYFRLKSDAL